MIRKLVRPARSFLLPSIEYYAIGDFQIALNRGHLLPVYQANNRLYDRFLPVLCRYLNNTGGWIIDVGANVGDTTFAFVGACNNPILAIEGHDAFYALLKQNVERLPKCKERIKIVNVLVGTGKFSGGLSSNGTTAVQTAAGSLSPSVSLDDVLRAAGVEMHLVALLKVDVDGYDADVILSAPDMLAASKPILFWENAFSTPEQLECFEQLYARLEEIGYFYLWPFDNFGNPVLEECSFKAIREINKYVAAQNVHRATRTFYYIDILATTDRDLEVARAAINGYRSEIIER
jgi:FkbM family methyltransferase